VLSNKHILRKTSLKFEPTPPILNLVPLLPLSVVGNNEDV